MNIKEQLYKLCQNYVNQRLQTVEAIITSNQKALQSETKSSAGDKHETSRAMAHLENERLGRQLEILNLQLETIYSINPKSTNPNITLGSIIECMDFTFFISTGLGKLKLANGFLFYAIAIESPIGKQLISKKVNDTILVGKNLQTIDKIM